METRMNMANSPDLTHSGGPKARLDDELSSLISLGGSDLHLGGGRQTMLRIDGGLRESGRPEWSAADVASVLQEIVAPDKWQKFKEVLELDFAYQTASGSRFRANVYRQQGNLSAAFRHITNEIKSLEQLGLGATTENFTKLSRGLILVTGPTGSGKSTTLASLINQINLTRADHIMTIEDPIEFVHASKKALINQREIGADTTSFNLALKHVLRQDPDVILIGEMRDFETISAALTAAETGHLVMGTLHTQDAPQTIDRIVDVFPSFQQAQIRTQLASTLKGIISQALIPKLEGPGRVVATEILVSTPAISNLIREAKTFQIHTAIQSGREFGMHTMDQSLASLALAGTISREAAEDHAHDKSALEQLIQGGQRTSSGMLGNF